MSGLVSKQTSKHKGTVYVCDYCLNYFGSHKVLDKHMENCSKHEAVNTILPKPCENILRFKNIQNYVECPIIIYADTESFITTIDETCEETKLYQQHVMSTFCLYVVSRIEGFSMDPVVGFKTQVTTLFLKELDGKQTKLLFSIFTKVPMQNT